VFNEQMFQAMFAVECRTRCEAVAISPNDKTAQLKNHLTGEITSESYDKLVLSPGAAPICPPLPGIDLPGIRSTLTSKVPLLYRQTAVVSSLARTRIQLFKSRMQTATPSMTTLGKLKKEVLNLSVIIS
jgi:NADPH-dependent 2,4-dienoyl-CoA reductase/sulfur reductase-like enzyme